MTPDAVQAIIAIVTVIGAGFGSYLGVKMSITEQKKDIEFHNQRLLKLETIFEKIADIGLNRPCDTHDKRMREIEATTRETERALDLLRGKILAMEDR